MLLTISTTHSQATDLGYLLHKNPARPQTFELPFGSAHVFYPEATRQGCTALHRRPAARHRPAEAGPRPRRGAHRLRQRPVIDHAADQMRAIADHLLNSAEGRNGLDLSP